ncbi:DNA-binding SARP family transcriptional activator [Pseudarthrobacter sp. PvP004]|uniref:AfsR/SARP family transcriptional regulator n=1 Tax=Pseudarthrobacter sp. PvP004 TaxID=2817850 RepID=UPI001AE6D83E|nr:BTAD domain-containing putative transcriptional regulator [Pseudarthrobacter sp. PvP004]MBP2268703.1 DNA-binding SARP family transcriptional activator [Pseudarthrobacter sp. PvP004]
MSNLQIRVLGPISVIADGVSRELTKRRHREIIGILVAQRGRAMSTASLIEELWDGSPAEGAVGAVRTFVGELRRILEPHRPPRTPPSVLLTVGDGYALRLNAEAVDAWGFESAVAAAVGASPEEVDSLLSTALSDWHGAAFEEFAERPWAISEVKRLTELRKTAVEHCAEARLDCGRPADAVSMLEAHVEGNPWREEGWRLLALALYGNRRQGDALAALRRARSQLVNELGLDPSPGLVDLEGRILRGDSELYRPKTPGLAMTATAYSRGGTRVQLEASNAVLGSLAVAGNLQTVRTQRLAAIQAAADLNDPELTARIIGGYDVPGIWTRTDDPAAAAVVIAAAEDALAANPRLSDRSRARLLATIAMESRGTGDRHQEACEAESIARRLGDAQLLCFALSARFMQTFAAAGLAAQRADIGQQLIAAAFDADSPTFEINGRLIRMQALCAMNDINSASTEADAVDQLALRHQRPLASVFTHWFRWTFLTSNLPPPLPTEMPGFADGIAALATLGLELRQETELGGAELNSIELGSAQLSDGDFGPYERWVRPLLLVRAGARGQAAEALRRLPDPPHDLLLEATWCIVAQAACEVGEPSLMRRALAALEPAKGERAAGSGVVDLGRVDHYLGLLGAGDVSV